MNAAKDIFIMAICLIMLGQVIVHNVFLGKVSDHLADIAKQLERRP